MEFNEMILEIKENTIRQWYQANDRKPDEEVIQPWLDNYVAQLEGKRLRTAV